MSFVKNLKAMGGTAIDDALKKALSVRNEGSGDRESGPEARRPLVIIFLTDGRPTVGVTDEDQILESVRKGNPSKNRVFCFGIGTDVNTHLLDKITEATRAVSQYVLPEEDLEVKVSNFFAKINEPVLADPVLTFTGDIRATKLYPSPLPDLFKGSQLVLAGRYSGEGSSAAIIEGTVNGRKKKFTFEFDFPRRATEHEFLPRLWATRRVGYLLDEIRLHGDNTELRDEVTDLARKYGIVTPYTAYLIVEDEARRNLPSQVRSMPALEGDRAARDLAASTWSEFRTERGGSSGVAGAQQGLALKSADASAPAASAGADMFARRYGISPRQAPGMTPTAPAQKVGEAGRLLQYSQQTQFVGGKTFFWNDSQWIDAEVQKYPKAKRERIQFGSAQYFDFVARNSAAAPWLALGQKVQFLVDGVVYEIYPASP